jgi:hypothetical protein
VSPDESACRHRPPASLMLLLYLNCTIKARAFGVMETLLCACAVPSTLGHPEHPRALT